MIVATFTNIIDGELQSRASVLHSSMAAIEKQQRDVEKGITELRKENDKLEKVASDYGRKVLEIGNVQNWAEMLERDFLVLEETMRLVNEGGADSDSDSWSGTWSGSGSECGTEVGESARDEGVEGEPPVEPTSTDGSGSDTLQKGLESVARGEDHNVNQPAEENVETSALMKGKEPLPREVRDVDVVMVDALEDNSSKIEVASSHGTDELSATSDATAVASSSSSS